MPNPSDTSDEMITPQAPPESAKAGAPPPGAVGNTRDRTKATQQRLVVELTELLLSNGVAGTVLSSRVIEALDARLKTREEQRQKRLAVFLSLGGLLGFGGISVILNSFVERAVKEENTELTRTMDKTIENRFTALASATEVATRELLDLE